MRINSLGKKKILVVGDVMLDSYFLGEISRISPEAPVPVFKKKSERCVLGGAANVAANLVAANQDVSIMSIIGNDDIGEKLVDLLDAKGINSNLLFKVDRCTTLKTRFLAGNNQQVIRLDVEDTSPISKEICQELLLLLSKSIAKYDMIVVSDYLKGLLTQELTQGIIKLANEENISVVIDVKDSKYGKYYGATLLKPNLNELRLLTGKNVNSIDDIIKVSNELRERCGCKYILTTLGARGMILVGEQTPYHVNSSGKEVFDVSGAGDTVIAYLSACMANKFVIKDAVDIANYAAGIQVGKVGTSSVSWQEVCYLLRDSNTDASRKLLSTQSVDSFRFDHSDKKVVFTNGCFDILHVGHKRYLEKAAALGDILVVGVNSDDSVRRLKGPDRPINNELERAEMLCSMGFIDYVVIFNEDTPYNLISKIQPDVLVKGGDYKPEEVVGRDVVEARGGRLEIISFVEGKSTTNIINKINKKYE